MNVSGSRPTRPLTYEECVERLRWNGYSGTPLIDMARQVCVPGGSHTNPSDTRGSNRSYGSNPPAPSSPNACRKQAYESAKVAVEDIGLSLTGARVFKMMADYKKFGAIASRAAGMAEAYRVMGRNHANLAATAARYGERATGAYVSAHTAMAGYHTAALGTSAERGVDMYMDGKFDTQLLLDVARIIPYAATAMAGYDVYKACFAN